ncbi:MAG: flagellar export chaperone FlgN [Bacteroidota bacterium]
MKLDNEQTLKQALRDLIDAFTDIRALLEKQTEAVINHDLDKVNALAEQQLTVNSKLEEREKEFKQQLEQSFADQAENDPTISLTALLTLLDEEGLKTELRSLRKQLVTQVTEAQQQQKQLNDLLTFAQQNVNETLKSVYALGNQQSVHYDRAGQTSHSDRSMINQTG